MAFQGVRRVCPEAAGGKQQPPSALLGQANWSQHIHSGALGGGANANRNLCKYAAGRKLRIEIGTFL